MSGFYNEFGEEVSSGGSVPIEHDGVAVVLAPSFINFKGAVDVLANGTGVDITITGGGGGFNTIAITGTINDSNVTFTAPSDPALLVINGAVYLKTGGAITWSYSAGSITLSSPVGTGGSIYGLVPAATSAKRETTQTTTSSATINMATTDIFSITALASGVTFNVPSNTPTYRQSELIIIKDNGSAQSIAWNAIFHPIGTTLPLTTVPGKWLYVGVIYNTTSAVYDVTGVTQEV